MLVYRRADGMRNFHRSMAEHVSCFSLHYLSAMESWPYSITRILVCSLGLVRWEPGVNTGSGEISVGVNVL